MKLQDVCTFALVEMPHSVEGDGHIGSILKFQCLDGLCESYFWLVVWNIGLVWDNDG